MNVSTQDDCELIAKDKEMRHGSMLSLATVATTLALATRTESTIRPCDIYTAASTPCVAAHSVVRALYGAYDGPLYVVKRSDNQTKAIGVLEAGGFADSAAQVAFCGSLPCTIERIFDQSPRGNDIDVAPAGSHVRHADRGVNASRSKLHVGGHPVFAAYFEGGMGYRREKTSGVAKGDAPESIYMVTNGKHYISRCCFVHARVWAVRSYNHHNPLRCAIDDPTPTTHFRCVPTRAHAVAGLWKCRG